MVQVRGAPPSRRARIACHMPTGRVRPQFRRAARSDVRPWGKRSGQASRPRCSKKPGSGAWGERRRSPARGKSRRRGDVRRDVALVVGRRVVGASRSGRPELPYRFGLPCPEVFFPRSSPLKRRSSAMFARPSTTGARWRQPNATGRLGPFTAVSGPGSTCPGKPARHRLGRCSVRCVAAEAHPPGVLRSRAARPRAAPRHRARPRTPVAYGPGHPRPPAQARPRPCTRRPVGSRPERERSRRSEDGPAGAGGTGRRSPSGSLASRPPDGCPVCARRGSCPTAPGRDRQSYAAASKPVSRASFFSSNRACFSI